MRINIHEAGDAPASVHSGISEDTKLSELLVLEQEERLYLLDSDEEVDITLTVVEVFGPTGGHAIKHSCKKIDVTVNYSGNVATFHVEPSARVKRC